MIQYIPTISQTVLRTVWEMIGTYWITFFSFRMKTLAVTSVISFLFMLQTKILGTESELNLNCLQGTWLQDSFFTDTNGLEDQHVDLRSVVNLATQSSASSAERCLLESLIEVVLSCTYNLCFWGKIWQN